MKHVRLIKSPYDWEKEEETPDVTQESTGEVTDLDEQASDPKTESKRLRAAQRILSVGPVVVHVAFG